MTGPKPSGAAALAAFSLFLLLRSFPTHAFAPLSDVGRCSAPSKASPSTSSSLFVAGGRKGPRFAQQVHKKSKKKRPAKARESRGRQKAPSEPKPWDTGKSIDDLESSMMSRWGTYSGQPALSDKETPRIDRGKPKPRKKSSSDSASPGLSLRPQVLDPWMDEAKTGAKFMEVTEREYYDYDDEEIYGEIEWDGPAPSDGSVVIEEPVASETGSPGFFFNPDVAQKPNEHTQNVSSGRDDKRESPTAGKTTASTVDSDGTSTGEVAKPKRRTPLPPALAVLDEDGEPILLTLDEAMYRFQSSLDGSAAELLDEDDSDDEQADWMEKPLISSAMVAPTASWTDLGIYNRAILDNLEAMECHAPLAVQKKAVPPAMEGRDVLVGTYTGSGKTLAFLTPLIQRLLDEVEENRLDVSRMGLAILIVAPGRELASQIVSVARQLTVGTGLTVQLSIGGTTFSRNLQQIRRQKPNILVGTPGRIAELVVGKAGDKGGRLKIGALRALVMDEFDALLEYKPHREPTRAIMEALRRRHRDNLQSIWCSATASDLADSDEVKHFLRPGYVEAMADQDDMLVTKSDGDRKAPRVSSTVMHGVIHVPHKRMALSVIRRILHTEPNPQQILIFVDNARKVDIVVDRLGVMGILAAPLHGGVGSDKMDRAEVSKALREGYVGVVVATELAARGLDAPLLTHVINMDLPTDASHYAHRAGRCGRGGRPGVVVNLTTSAKERKVPSKFARALGIDMHTVEARAGKLVIVDPNTIGV